MDPAITAPFADLAQILRTGRITMLAGDAFALDFGGPYDVVLVTNFFHHFDVPTCEGLIEKYPKR